MHVLQRHVLLLPSICSGTGLSHCLKDLPSKEDRSSIERTVQKLLKSVTVGSGRAGPGRSV